VIGRIADTIPFGGGNQPGKGTDLATGGGAARATEED